MVDDSHGKSVLAGRQPGWLRQRWRARMKLRFLVVGAANTLAGYLTFAALYLLAGAWLHYLLVALASHFLAVCLAYYLQRTVVFRSTGPVWPEFLRYNISLMTVLLGGIVGLYFFVSGLGFPPLHAQAIITLLSIAVSYLSHRHFTFNSPAAHDGIGQPHHSADKVPKEAAP